MKTPRASSAFIATLIYLIGAYWSLPAVAATHWVSSTGTATYASCVGSTPLTGTSACSLTTANASATAGDLIYLRAGTYNTAISPSRNGSGTPPSGPFNFITFMAYTGETPTINAANYEIELQGISWIRVSGITFTIGSSNAACDLSLGSNYNELDNNTFNSNGYAITCDITSLATGSGGPWATNNWVHGNTFNTSGQAHGTEGTGCTDGGGDVMDIGHAYSGSNPYSLDNNNTVENNVFNHAPHATIDGYGEYTVIRNNVFHNEPWSSGCSETSNYSNTAFTNTAYNGSYGHRDAQYTDDYDRPMTYNLIESNRYGYASINQDNLGDEDFDLATPGGILRYSFFYASMGACLQFKYSWGGGLGSGGNGGTYNRTYNNTFYDCGIGWPPATKALGDGCNTESCPSAAVAVSNYAGSGSATGNVLKNNLIYEPDSLGYAMYHGDAIDSSPGGTSPPFSPTNSWAEFPTATHNWCTSITTLNSSNYCSASGNPLFNNPDITNPASTTLPDLTLQAGSSALNGGTYLTTATNSGANSTTLTVADAQYFQDGTWGSALAKQVAGLGGTFQPDCIAVGTVTNHVCISAVSYGTYNAPGGTITLASPATWANGAQIWLYSKSDGTVVLTGTAPNYGAGLLTGSGSTPQPQPPTQNPTSVQQLTP